MKKSAICRAISEALEAIPVEPCGFDTELSALGFWEWKLSPGCAIKSDWQPLNYFTSEDASARLLEAMPSPSLSKMVGYWDCVHHGANEDESFHADRKTAIVLAACIWLKIDVDTIEDEPLPTAG